MHCIFRNPITKTLEVGLIFKRIYSSKGKHYHVINELGSVFLHLPSLEGKLPTDSGYVDFDLTETIMPHIETNLNLNTQANYRDKHFVPEIRKFTVQ